MSTQKNDKIGRALKFYVTATKLKDMLRTGWLNWHISKERSESIAEHVYGTSILAIALDSELDIDIDLNKVLRMIVLHELEEIIIGDLTPYDDVTEEDKLQQGADAVATVLEGMDTQTEYEQLLHEFNAHETKESQFAFMCDKLEADLQSKIYSEQGYFDVYSPENKKYLDVEWLSDENGKRDLLLSDLFIAHSRKYFDMFPTGELFNALADYIQTNKIS